jgi:hypothetical protein
MAVLALVFWSATALGGLYLLAIWLIEYDPGFQHAAASRLPALVITGHVLFAVVGLLSWVTFLITAKEIYSWTSAAALAAIATLGFTMAIRWLGVYRAWRGPPPRLTRCLTRTGRTRCPRGHGCGLGRPERLARPATRSGRGR